MARIVQEFGERGHRYVSPYNVARVYGAIDDKPRALEWLERAYQEHNPDLIELTREPSFASLRSDSEIPRADAPDRLAGGLRGLGPASAAAQKPTNTVSRYNTPKPKRPKLARTSIPRARMPRPATGKRQRR